MRELVQFATLRSFAHAVDGNPVLLGTYYGAQTALFEVGGAFLVAAIAVALGRFRAKDAEGFSIGLGFWENAMIFAPPLLLDYVVYYVVLSHLGSTAAQSLYPTLHRNAPALFDGRRWRSRSSATRSSSASPRPSPT